MFEAVKLLIKNETTKTNVNFFIENFYNHLYIPAFLLQLSIYQ